MFSISAVNNTVSLAACCAKRTTRFAMLSSMKTIQTAPLSSRASTPMMAALAHATRFSHLPSPISCTASKTAKFTTSAPVMHTFARVQKPAPTWSSKAVVGKEIKSLSSEDYLGKWLVLFFYPLDFTFVCPTEIISYSKASEEFRKLNTEVVGISVDSVYAHLAWINQPRKLGGLGDLDIPLVSDITKNISHSYGVLADSGGDIGLSLRGTFIIDPKGVVRQITINDTGVGRNIDETLRLVEALQFVDEHGEVCPAGWKKGEKTMTADPIKSKEYFQTVSE
ncbi:hypothetical protein BASA50_003847 [Batrachochytrium salamandrivorans]|uniref:Thioredoxin domain-containing protein n=1 Tax=Batrachochytrium salamandrivorans TaxID=1357716 RepID=A0ABQ8FK90_9FUNG|nr:hypothetical protein BASA62_000590 [Batrachochytrium salamandrivorans]KAH6578557.1 hypothetical protein BASA60_003602 [Batrachochytrium salamandrivorans]KAH6590622.1 hypothetical protein BASA61_005213 [Batrachochytrium salamandrivorans]KAH6598233.1 hypothetical protein BASA50_003847 [Batrachochytrium salamandrivorans]KAH9251454.1 hypothetical protein BASA81_010691 [Batrachochytrium salamandrivorans]